MISGITGITSVADGCFVLTKSERMGSDANLICVGRDIEQRELELSFDKETKLWSLLADSVQSPNDFIDEVVLLVAEFVKSEKSFIGSTSELLEKIQSDKTVSLIANTLSKKLIQNRNELLNLGVRFENRRTNGKRILELNYFSKSAVSDESDDKTDISLCDEYVDPVGTDGPNFTADERATA